MMHSQVLLLGLNGEDLYLRILKISLFLQSMYQPVSLHLVHYVEMPFQFLWINYGFFGYSISF